MRDCNFETESSGHKCCGSIHPRFWSKAKPAGQAMWQACCQLRRQHGLSCPALYVRHVTCVVQAHVQVDHMQDTSNNMWFWNVTRNGSRPVQRNKVIQGQWHVLFAFRWAPSQLDAAQSLWHCHAMAKVALHPFTQTAASEWTIHMRWAMAGLVTVTSVPWFGLAEPMCLTRPPKITEPDFCANTVYKTVVLPYCCNGSRPSVYALASPTVLLLLLPLQPVLHSFWHPHCQGPSTQDLPSNG